MLDRNMLFYREKLLSPTQLKRLGEHKYSYSSSSLLDPFLQPYWNWLVSKVPPWLAPNLITVVGLIINIVTTLILVWFSPDARGEAPRWACFICALGLFVYQSLDAIDGKQARLTGTSTPLGELFDHGCDSISTACVAVQLGHYPAWMFFQCFCAMTLFYCAHWQTYVSGTLKFSKIDVTEAQFTIIFIHLVSAIFGPSVWTTKLTDSVFMHLNHLSVIVPKPPGSINVSKQTQHVRASIKKNLHPELVQSTFFKNDFNEPSQVTSASASCSSADRAVYSDFFELRYFIGIMTFIVASGTMYQNLIVICTGGVGKNGSTVAIPLLDGRLTHVVSTIFYLGFARVFLSFMQIFEEGGVGKNGSTVALLWLSCLLVVVVQLPGLMVEVKLVPISIAVMMTLLLAYSNISIIVQGGVGKNGSTVAGTSVLSPIIPFSMVVVPAFIIYRKSVEHVYENHPVLYILAFGMVAAKVTNRLVVAHMSKSELEYLDSSLIGPAMLFLNQYFNFFIQEYIVLWLCLVRLLCLGDTGFAPVLLTSMPRDLRLPQD
uniref:diacylglycerol cholinephosphotransferase n=1 Tax=Timema poppense TaxID=170557 RepID=A0A7R9CK88_TIMPO|nr:unnamed protein product [Timema poppensis]